MDFQQASYYPVDSGQFFNADAPGPVHEQA
jgi:hypothetical protein